MIHNYLIIYINFAGLLLSKKRMKGKNSKGLIQKTGYMQEKDQKESIPQTCLIQAKLCNQVRSLDHFVVQNSRDFLC